MFFFSQKARNRVENVCVLLHFLLDFEQKLKIISISSISYQIQGEHHETVQNSS